MDAREEGESLLTAWRLSYELPPTDPRWTEATEEMILRDLLVKRYHDEHIRRLTNPEAAAVEALAADPVGSAEKLERVKKATMEDAGTLRALHRLGLGAKHVEKVPTELRLTVRPSSPKKVTAP